MRETYKICGGWGSPGQVWEPLMYSMWKIMCFLNLKNHKHIALHQIHKIMFFLATSYDPFKTTLYLFGTHMHTVTPLLTIYLPTNILPVKMTLQTLQNINNSARKRLPSKTEECNCVLGDSVSLSFLKQKVSLYLLNFTTSRAKGLKLSLLVTQGLKSKGA